MSTQSQYDNVERRVLDLNNRACVLVLSKGDYSEANELFETALQMHKNHTTTNDGLVSSSPSQSPAWVENTCEQGPEEHEAPMDLSDADLDFSDSEFSDSDISEWDIKANDLLDMDWNDGSNPSRLPSSSSHSHISTTSADNSVLRSHPSSGTSVPTKRKISRMTSVSHLWNVSYCGQKQHHHPPPGDRPNKNYHHQIYNLPIVMDEPEWEMASNQDRSFVLIFNAAVCNHLWGLQLLEAYFQASPNHQSHHHHSNHPDFQHCQETLTVARLLYKLALESSLSFASGVDTLCYLALYNNLSHVCKILHGYHSPEAQWSDEMLLKAIFWWRDSTQRRSPHRQAPININNPEPNHTTHSPSSDLYRDEDEEIIDAFLDNVFYRIGVPEEVVPAAAA